MGRTAKLTKFSFSERAVIAPAPQRTPSESEAITHAPSRMLRITTTVSRATAKKLSSAVNRPSSVIAWTMSVVSTIWPATSALRSTFSAASRTVRACWICARPFELSVARVGNTRTIRPRCPSFSTNARVSRSGTSESETGSSLVRSRKRRISGGSSAAGRLSRRLKICRRISSFCVWSFGMKCCSVTTDSMVLFGPSCSFSFSIAAATACASSGEPVSTTVGVWYDCRTASTWRSQ